MPKWFGTYNCLTYGEESDDDQCVIKHQQLFALREEATEKILIDAYQNELVKMMDAIYFSKGKLTKILESLQLTSDDILDVVMFFKAIDDAIKTSHTMGYSPLPQVNELTATMGILELMLSRFDSRSYLYNKGQQFLGILGDALRGILKEINIDKIFP